MNNELWIDEVYDKVTYQGEGMDIGRPCIFLRVMGCPVKCPGCDTHWTWDKTERGVHLQVLNDQDVNIGTIQQKIRSVFDQYPGCGLVVSGGEPLLYYNNENLVGLLLDFKSNGRWIGLETSGFIGVVQPNIRSLEKFLSAFTSIHISPKITPCLHGADRTDEELLYNVPRIADLALNCGINTAWKFVCRDDQDVLVVRQFMDEQLDHDWGDLPVFLMPYGQDPDEIRKTSELLLPYVARYGYILSPRLQSLFWGAKRSV